MFRASPIVWVALVLVGLIADSLAPRATGAVTREEVERAIRGGIRFLLKQQHDDGSWTDVEEASRTGTTSLVTLSLLTAGESADSEPIQRSLSYLRKFDPGQVQPASLPGRVVDFQLAGRAACLGGCVHLAGAGRRVGVGRVQDQHDLPGPRAKLAAEGLDPGGKAAGGAPPAAG